ncbi:hypothetical protein [Nonomuraea sp. KM88]
MVVGIDEAVEDAARGQALPGYRSARELLPRLVFLAAHLSLVAIGYAITL